MKFQKHKIFTSSKFTLTLIDCGKSNLTSFSKRSTSPGIRDMPPIKEVTFEIYAVIRSLILNIPAKYIFFAISLLKSMLHDCIAFKISLCMPTPSKPQISGLKRPSVA